MTNQSSRHVLYVFLGSPGDLAEERRITRDVVDELNETHSRLLGWHIDLLGWEDTLPGFGRPQEIINRDVDLCHLFVGLLWRRWGQPTGKYSSGFEEEFERARNRRLEAGAPDIWLFFKQVDPEVVADPGEDLKRVLAFREARVTSKDVLFKNFTDPEDWRTQIRKYLSQYFVQSALEFQQATQVPSAGARSVPRPAESAAIGPPPHEQPMEPVNRQLMELMGTLSESITRGDLNIEPEETQMLDPFNIARLNLLAAAWMSRRYATTLLSSHEINLLYQYKEQVQLTESEKGLIFRSLVADSDDILPGWYWFRDLELISVEVTLFWWATRDGDDAVREGAVKILKSVNIPRSAGVFNGFDSVSTILRDSSALVRRAGLAYLASTGTMEDIPSIESALTDNDSSVRDEAHHAKLSIIARNAPNDAFSILLDPIQDTPNETVKAIVGEIGGRSTELRRELLEQALRHSDATMRTFAVKELSRREQLSREVASPLLQDSSVEVRELCYKEFIRQGETFDPYQVRQAFADQARRGRTILTFGLFSRVDVDELVLMLYRSFTSDRLLEKIDWYSIDGPVAYKALALDHFPLISDRIRMDLDDRFASIRESSTERLRSRHGDAAEHIMERYRDKLDDFMVMQFTEAALAGLAACGESRDVHIGRRHLAESDRDVQIEAIRIIERFGDASDVESLIRIVTDDFGQLKTMAASAALKIAPGVSGAARGLLRTEDPTLVALAIRSLRNDDPMGVFEVLEPLLGSMKLRTRSKVLSYFAMRSSREQLEALLLRYLGRDSYFYNVVCWIDRVLYSPPPLQEMFSSKLEAMLDRET